MKTLILYVFHEINERVYYFIENGIFKSDDYIFILISNNKNINIICPSYVKILIRDNIGYDFGGWSDALLSKSLYKDFDNFIFVNSSCIGPFTPSYFQGNWCDIFLNKITETTKLVGTTISTLIYGKNVKVVNDPSIASHVQSWLFCTDKMGLELLFDKKIFSYDYIKNHDDGIYKKEIPMSRFIIDNGWNISSLMTYYDDIDFRFDNLKPADYNIKYLGDAAYNGQYANSTTHPYEFIFVKANRNISIEWINIYKKKVILKEKIELAIYGNKHKLH